jgi:hypothetical protein
MIKHKGLFARLHERFFGRETNEKRDELLIAEPEESFEDEIAQTIDKIQLDEQLRMIRIVNDYAEQFIIPGLKKDPAWSKGFALQNKIFVTLGDEPVYRCNMDYFYQDFVTGEKKILYVVTLVRFVDEDWLIFQVKGVMPSPG